MIAVAKKIRFYAGTTVGFAKLILPLRSRVWSPSAAAASRHNQSRTHYTPELTWSQYIVVTFFFNTIGWVFWRITWG